MLIAIAPLLLAAAPFIASAVGAGLAAHGAKKSREHQAEMLERQKQINIDNWNMQREASIEDWHRQNAYNSPLQQMQRLREAGLNPHLIYGKGADNTGAVIRASSSSNASTPPAITSPMTAALEGAQSSMGLITGLRMQKAQIDNLYAQRAATDAKTAETLQNISRSKFDLEQADRAKDIVFEQLVQNWMNSQKSGEGIQLENEMKETQIFRLSQLTPLEIEKTTQEIENLKATRDLTYTQKQKLIADTEAIIDGNKRANELQDSTKQILLLQINEKMQTLGKAPITMPELNAKLDLMSTDTALKKFELEFQQTFRALGDGAKTLYMTAMLFKMLKDAND